MEVLQATILGVVQGLAEFLPISSSGHLKLIHEGLGWSDFGLAYDTFLHVATLLAVAVYFRSDLVRMARSAFSSEPTRADDRRLAWLVVAATVPTGVIGLVGNGWFEDASLLWIGVAFLLTSVVLIAADRLSRSVAPPAERLGWGRGLLVGVAQGLAIMPGLSRSGATMSAGMALGLDREQAARFSFLLSVPIILLAAVKQGIDVLGDAQTLPSLPAVLAGFIAAALTGYVAIALLMRLLRNHTFLPFAVYTALLGSAVIVWQLAG
ncbi:MAG: undecaprenyl-diphosphatase UppP [Actinomycetota bacterium]|nr:undecaprenyl-diphosphatase UppP [Actinomycetota bacterium]